MSKPVCITSGSSSGIGAATALLFAERGYDVVVNYSRDKAQADEVAAQCRAAGADVLVLQADIGDDASCRDMAAQVQKRWGRADALVNNAGRTKFAAARDLEALSAEDFVDICRLNVAGIFQLTRAFVPLLQASPKASVTNVSSIASLTGAGSSIAYAASKGAVNTLTLSLARALGPSIRVNAVLPGMVDGVWLRKGMGAEGFARGAERYRGRAILEDLIQPVDVAKAIWWLANEADKTTGHLVPVEAGAVLGKL